MMNVGEAANASGLSVKTLHYYEEIGLVVPKRQENGYRAYSESDVHKLNFIHRARGLGFTVEACRELLSLYEDRNRASADVKAIAGQHLEEVETKIEELKSLRETIKDLHDNCRGDHRPDCPIIDGLASVSH
jgi:Cu(I)-responsive transcriptional regulator